MKTLMRNVYAIVEEPEVIQDINNFNKKINLLPKIKVNILIIFCFKRNSRQIIISKKSMKKIT